MPFSLRSIGNLPSPPPPAPSSVYSSYSIVDLFFFQEQSRKIIKISHRKFIYQCLKMFARI